MVAEGARIALRELAGMIGIEGKGRVLVAEQERRSRLGKVLNALLHTPGVTARGTADLLGITHQTATS
jgi:hypothetical protein